MYNIKTVDRITLPSLTNNVNVGDVVIGQRSKARAIINKDAVTGESTIEITDIKGSFIDGETPEDITIIHDSNGNRDNTSITKIRKTEFIRCKKNKKCAKCIKSK